METLNVVSGFDAAESSEQLPGFALYLLLMMTLRNRRTKYGRTICESALLAAL